ncbi:hypothetical protein [Herbaspirillum frisingense]|nr:hypothetical protein [Herbaspirillum frisingense]UIN21219.1 hypothetical protein LAZ82_22645 [Herbaspirillum frisingense]
MEEKTVLERAFDEEIAGSISDGENNRADLCQLFFDVAQQKTKHSFIGTR